MMYTVKLTKEQCDEVRRALDDRMYNLDRDKDKVKTVWNVFLNAKEDNDGKA